jgi:putative ABC transport system substrate-binding protein
MLGLKRREFITLLGGAAVSWPVAVGAQPSRVWRLGYLTSVHNVSTGFFDAFRQELTNLGYVQGKNLLIEVRTAEGYNDRLPSLAAELVSVPCDVIVAVATPAIAAAQKATSTIPIVMSPSTDPIGSGFIKSFAHPGGNITGVANLFGDMTAKTIEVLHEMLPDAKKIAVLLSSNPTHPSLYKVAHDAAQSLGLSTVPVLAPTPADLESAFQNISREHCEALFVLADPIRLAIMPLAAKFKIPAIYQYAQFVDAGGLVSYGANVTIMFRKAAQYVDKIFKGANPADLPVEQPTTFELVINVKTAKALGLTIPESFLLRADKVIE